MYGKPCGGFVYLPNYPGGDAAGSCFLFETINPVEDQGTGADQKSAYVCEAFPPSPPPPESSSALVGGDEQIFAEQV